MGIQRRPFRPQKNSKAGRQTDAVPTEPTELTATSPTPEFEVSLHSGPEVLLSLCFEDLQALLGIYLKAFSFYG